MKRFLIFLLLALSLSGAMGALSPPVLNPQGAATKIIQSVSAAAFTNMILNSAYGDLIIVPPGTYVIPAMTNMARPGVNWFFYPGAQVISMGGSSWIADGATASGTTNSIWGHGEFVISNNVPFCTVDTWSPTKIYIECKSIWHADTNHSSELFTHNVGRLTVRAAEFLRHEGYDIYVYDGLWQDAANFFVDISASEWIAAENALEIPGPIDAPGRAVFTGSTFRKLTNTVAATSSEFMLLSGHVVVRAGTINLATNAIIQGTTDAATDGTRPRIEADTIFALSGSPSFALTIGGVHIVGARMIGAPNIDPILLNSRNVTLENCEIINGTGSTNCIRAVSALSATVIGALRVSNSGTNGVHDFVAVNGGPIIGQPYTNNYAGTNVFWNSGGHTDQVLDATNAMLLVVTNATTLESGKTGRLVMINNKATNMNVAISAAGLRLFGVGGQLATSTSFTVTNGRTSIVTYERIGTNNTLIVSQQQN